MDYYPEIKCDDCGWEGFALDLERTQEEVDSGKTAAESNFNRCPDCESSNISDYDTDDVIWE